MSLLNSLLSNKAMINVAMSTLKNVFTNSAVKYIVITQNNDGEIDVVTSEDNAILVQITDDLKPGKTKGVGKISDVMAETLFSDFVSKKEDAKEVKKPVSKSKRK